MVGSKLKPFHHIRVNGEMREDLRMWQTFIEHPSIYARSFADFHKTILVTEIRMMSDASRAVNLGFGGINGKLWMYGQWPAGFIEQEKPSIEYLELFAFSCNCGKLDP